MDITDKLTEAAKALESAQGEEVLKKAVELGFAYGRYAQAFEAREGQFEGGLDFAVTQMERALNKNFEKIFKQWVEKKKAMGGGLPQARPKLTLIEGGG